MTGTAKTFLKRAAALLAVLCLLCLQFSALAEYDPNRPDLLEQQDLNCTACILVEAETGTVVFEKNADVAMYPASTTKIMTVLLALENCDCEHTTAVVSEAALFNTPSDSTRLGDSADTHLIAGEEVNLLDLLYGTILHSANDGALVIAERVGGTVDNFVGMMNAKAAQLGCRNTHFANPHGYHDENHYTCARDMAIIARYAMENPQFADIANSTSHTMAATNLNGRRKITLNNNFFRTNYADYADCYYPYGNGIKTGYTNAAGYCYVGSAKNENGVRLISVVFGCKSRAASFRDTVKLMEYGFSQYMITSIAEIYTTNPKVVEISGFDTADRAVGKLTLNLRPKSNTDKDRIVTTKAGMTAWSSKLYDVTVTEFTRAFDAPITEKEVMGTISYYPEQGGEPIVYELIASRSVARRADLAPTVDQIKQQAEEGSPFPRLTVEILLLKILLPLIILAAFVWLLIRISKRLRKRPKRRVISPKQRYFT